MTDYTKTTDFTSKDSLPSGDSGKIIRGAEFGTEFDNIETAVNSKSNKENPSFTGNITVTGTVDGRDIAADGTKLDTIETSADVTDTANVTAAGAVMDSELTDITAVKALNQGVATTDSPTFAAVTSTGNVTVGGTVDGRDVAADGTKLDTVETNADVTDTTNVTAAGALMDSEVTNLAQVKAFDSADYATAAQGTTADNALPKTGGAMTGAITTNSTFDGRDVATDGTKLDGIEALADVTDTTNVTAAGAVMDSELTSEAAVKALNQGVATTDSPTFAGATVNGTVEFDGLSGTGAVTVTDILDQDNMSSNSATALATQQSIKAYVDSQVATSDTLAEVLANGNATGGTDVAFGDNDKAIFGAGSDLEILSNGTDGLIRNGNATGEIRMESDDRIIFADRGFNEVFAVFNDDDDVKLYHNGSQKLATTSTGIDVTGVITTDGMTTSADINFGDNDKAIFGAGNDLQIYHDGSNSYVQDAGSGNLYLRQNGTAVIIDDGTNNLAAFNSTSGESALYYGGSGKKLATTSTGIDVTGTATMDGLVSAGTAFVNLTSRPAGVPATAGALWSAQTETGNYGIVSRASSTDSFTYIGNTGSAATLGTSYGSSGSYLPLHLQTSDKKRLSIAANGDISFYEDTGTTAKFFWDAAAESLGIGTSSPSSSYAVDATSGFRSSAAIPNFTLVETDASNQTWQINSTAAKLSFRDLSRAADRIVVDTAGNVGIGTDSPAAKLDTAYTDSATYSATSPSADLILSRKNTANSNNQAVGIRFDVTGWSGSTTGGVAIEAIQPSNASTADLAFLTRDAGTWGERMRIDSSGNVGIGTSSPSSAAGFDAKLQLEAANPMLVYKETDQSTKWEVGAWGGNYVVYNGSSERMRLDASGNLQVGDNTFAAGKLRVYDTAGNHIWLKGRVSDGNASVSFRNNADNAYNGRIATDDTSMNFQVNGSERFRIASDGSLSTPTAGTSNVRFGVNAGNSIASGGNYNVVVGDEAGTAITTGDNNVAVGFEALKTLSTSSQNTAVGHTALKFNTGANNTAFGYAALTANSTGTYNVALGRSAGASVTTGVQNTLIGGLAGDALTDADDNTALGVFALTADTLGSKTTAIGASALGNQNFTSATDSYNTAVGYYAGLSVTTGIQNTLIGGLAGDALTDADFNAAVGVGALGADTLGSRSTAVGQQALGLQNFTSATDTYNTAVGFFAGLNVTTGVQNTLIGGLVGDALTDADYNTAVGYSALTSDTLGSRSVAVGTGALGQQNFTSATNAYNTAVGMSAGGAVTTGIQNTFVGGLSGDGATIGLGNTALGYNSLSATLTGNHNVALGFETLKNCTSGPANVCIGYRTATLLTTGDNNTAVGVVAMGNGTITGSTNTALGYAALYSLTSGTDNLALGRDAGRSGSPGGQVTTGDRGVFVGDENITAAHIQVDWTVASDARDKTDFTALDLGLDFVKDLKPVTYKWDKRSKYGDKSADGYDLNAQTPDGTHKEDWLDIGFKAQEVEALEIAAGYTKDNKTNLVSSHTDDGKQMGLQYSKFVPILVKAIQEQQALIDALTARIETLEG